MSLCIEQYAMQVLQAMQWGRQPAQYCSAIAWASKQADKLYKAGCIMEFIAVLILLLILRKDRAGK